jgi:hypothetical protein
MVQLTWEENWAQQKERVKYWGVSFKVITIDDTAKTNVLEHRCE